MNTNEEEQLSEPKHKIEGNRPDHILKYMFGFAALGFIYLAYPLRNYDSAVDFLKNNAEIVQIKGEEQTKNRDFPVYPHYFDGLRNVHQKKHHITRSNDGGLVILTAFNDGFYAYKKDKNLDGILDAEGFGHYNPLIADTIIVCEHTITQKIRYTKIEFPEHN